MKRLPSLLTSLLLAVLGLVVLFIFRDYGLAWDSEVQKNYGNLVLLYYLTGFANKTAFDYIDLQYFGGGFESVLQIVANTVLFATDGNLFETRHLLGGLTGLGGVYVAYRLGRLLGTRWTGFLAALFLALSPRFFGHMFNNSKDAPMGVFYLLTLYWTVRFFRSLPRPDRKTILWLGLAMGFTMSIRVGAGVLFVYLLAAALAYFVFESKNRTGDLRTVLLALFFTGLLAWVVMLLFWPWAQVQPILRPIQAALLFTKYDYNTPQLFQGGVVSSRDLPLNYIPVWWSIKVPEFYFVLFLAPLLLLLRRTRTGKTNQRRDSIAIGVLALAVLFPPALAMARGMVLTDGIRHFLFLTPPLAVLAALTVTNLFERLDGFLAAGRYLLGALLLSSLLLTARDMVVLHPYQTVYFNRLFGGGVKEASQRFDFDYWGWSLKAGVEWLLAHHKPEPGRIYTVAGCSQPSQIEYWLNNDYYSKKDQILFRYGRSMDLPSPEILRFLNNPPGPYKAVPDQEKPDFLLATARFDCPKKYPGRVLHTIRREEADLLYIIQVTQ